MKQAPRLTVWNPGTVLAVGSLLAMFLVGGCGGHARSRPLASLSEEDRDMLDQYEGMRVALATDDFRLAKRKATNYLKALDEKHPSGAKPPVADAVGKIASAVTLENERDGFRTWSAQAIELSNGVQGFYVIHCPIPGCGDWLQRDDKVDNPYMGKAMHDCGEVQK